MGKQQVGNGIVRRGDGWVMLCGSTEQPVRYLDAQDREIEPEIETAESKGNENVDIAIKTKS